MIKKKTVAYYGLDKGLYKKNIKRSSLFKSPSWKAVFMLWGDHVYVIDIDDDNKFATVSAKGHIFDMPVKDLREDPILQFHQIDCGQGDAALIYTPDDRWLIVDGGPPRNWSNSGKIAIDFLMWKIFVDFSWRREFLKTEKPFHIDAIIVTHPDYDHYGGLMELTKKINTESGSGITIGTIFHNGLGRFGSPYKKYENGTGFSQLGPLEGEETPNAFLTTMIDGFDDVGKYLEPEEGRTWTLTGSYAEWLADLREKAGHGVGKLKRVHHGQGYLEGYEPGPDAENKALFKILGPVEETFNDKPVLRFLDEPDRVSSPSLTRNGISVVLRLDYKKFRLLLTGDLNFRSQALLFKHVCAQEFACHVAKACHHGSADISWKFLRAMEPTAVIFSSGDNEGYVHPRAKVLGWSGAFAHKVINSPEKKEFLGFSEEDYGSPLIYSTELSRSIKIWDPYKVYDKEGNVVPKAKIQGRGRTEPGKEKPKDFKDWLLAEKMIYGLVNVRSDGKRVVIGVLKEDGKGFHRESFDI